MTAKQAYAQAQADLLGRVDYAAGEVLYLNPAQTGPAVLRQKVHSLTTALRVAATKLSKLEPPGAAATLQRSEIAQLRSSARRLDAWVADHPKGTVGGVAGPILKEQKAVERVVSRLAAGGFVK